MTGGLTDEMCENIDHYRPWLWVSRVDQYWCCASLKKVQFISFIPSWLCCCCCRHCNLGRRSPLLQRLVWKYGCCWRRRRQWPYQLFVLKYCSTNSWTGFCDLLWNDKKAPGVAQKFDVWLIGEWCEKHNSFNDTGGIRLFVSWSGMESSFAKHPVVWLLCILHCVRVAPFFLMMVASFRSWI